LLVMSILLYFFCSSQWEERKFPSVNFNILIFSPLLLRIRNTFCHDYYNCLQHFTSRVGETFRQTISKHIIARILGKTVERYGLAYPTPNRIQTIGEGI
jgi:hypothetical protein